MSHPYTEEELRPHLDDALAELKSERAKKHPDEDYVKQLQEEASLTREELKRIAEQKERILALAGLPGHSQPGDDRGPEPRGSDLAARTATSEALRVVERHADLMSSAAADRLDRFVRSDDPTGIGARYLAATGAEAYNSGFGKLLLDPLHGHLRLSPQEVEAVRLVSAVQAERALAEGTDSAGGFAVPMALDPTVLLKSDGAVNPVRQFASVITVATSVWKGVSSAGVSASYDQEGAEVSDDTPSLAQPVVYVETARAFVPFSIEVGQDWGGIQAELARMLADGRDVLESGKFLSGAGHASNEPEGILAATQTVTTAGSGAYAIADAYSLVEAVPPRFQGSMSVLGSPGVFDRTYRFVGGASTEPPVLPTREGAFLGRRKGEWSAMSNTISAGEKILVAGDVRAGFRIADRLGMSVELVPHLFGANHRPTGQRGIFAYWRNGSGVILDEAIRVLVVKA